MTTTAFSLASKFLQDHPHEIYRILRSILGLRVGIPMAAFRWLSEQAEKSGRVKRLSIAARPPGIHVQADLDLMDTPVRASTVIYFERVSLSAEEMTLVLRLEEVSLTLTAESHTTVAALIKSKALDLSSPGTLARYLPTRPSVLVESDGNRLTLDLMRDPKIGQNPNVRNFMGLLTSFVTIHGVETDPDHLDMVLRAFPRGIVEAVFSVGRHMIRPSLSRLLPMKV